jgi:hypothetical protein
MLYPGTPDVPIRTAGHIIAPYDEYFHSNTPELASHELRRKLPANLAKSIAKMEFLNTPEEAGLADWDLAPLPLERLPRTIGTETHPEYVRRTINIPKARRRLMGNMFESKNVPGPARYYIENFVGRAVEPLKQPSRGGQRKRRSTKRRSSKRSKRRIRRSRSRRRK